MALSLAGVERIAGSERHSHGRHLRPREEAWKAPFQTDGAVPGAPPADQERSGPHFFPSWCQRVPGPVYFIKGGTLKDFMPRPGGQASGCRHKLRAWWLSLGTGAVLWEPQGGTRPGHREKVPLGAPGHRSADEEERGHVGLEKAKTQGPNVEACSPEVTAGKQWLEGLCHILVWSTVGAAVLRFA